MIKIDKTTISDFRNIKIQPEQQEEFEIPVNDGNIVDLVTFKDENNEILLIISLQYYWQNRAVVRAFFDENCGKKMIAIIKKLKEFAKRYLPARTEIEILENFRAAHRLAKIMGFRRESVMPEYFKGKTYFLYVRLKSWAE